MIYKSLKDLRLSKGFFQRNIADQAGISIPFYCMVESGLRVPSLMCAKKIAYILGISLDEFCIFIENNINKL